MSEKEMDLVIQGPWFYSELDEFAFFEWLHKIPCVMDIRGEGEELHLLIMQTVMDKGSLRELIALFFRYELDLCILKQFISEENRSWLMNTNTFWFGKMFDP